MLKRMWRAFWVAMREPVSAYASERTMTIRVDIDADHARAVLDELAEKAARLSMPFYTNNGERP